MSRCRTRPRRERAADDTKQGQPGQNMDRQVQGMITPHRRPADGMVDRQGKIQDGPAARGRVDRGPERGAPVSDRRVADDGRNVVEKQGNRKSPAVDRDGPGRENSAPHQPSPVRAPNGDAFHGRGSCRRTLRKHGKGNASAAEVNRVPGKMEPSTGFEPATCCLRNSRSNQLS